MAALKPEIIRDCIELIDFYKKNPAFRKRLDSAVKRNINVTYKHRPIKLYFEILAQVNLAKYKTTYQQLRGITLYDSEGLVGKTFLEVTPKDLSLLSLAASNAEKNINSTGYLDQEIEEINQIEETSKDQVQKTESYQKRLDATLPSTQATDQAAEAEKTPSAPSLPNMPRISGFIKTTGAKISSKLATGKALAAGAGKAIGKLGLGSAVRAGAGILAKLGVSLATGAATAGVGFVVGVVVTIVITFGTQLKQLFKLIFWVTVGLIAFIIFMFVAQRGMKMNSLLPPYDVGQITEAPTTPPTVDNPLVIIKSTDKSAVDIGENIEFTLKVEASLLAGNKIIVRDKIPNNTTFVSASDGGVLKGDTIEWNLDAVKSPGGKRIPIPQTGPPPAGSTLPLQRITANEAQIRADLEKNSPDYAKYAKAVFDAGKEFNVDPAFIMAIWWGESHYSKVGGLKNNPGSIVYVRDGYLGMKRGTYMNGRTWATWDTFEAGIKAIAELIATEYYSQGQTDTWKVHSGKDDSGTHAYHCRCDIGKGYGIDTWEDYVNFYYNWLETMSRVSGGSGYYLAKDLHLIVRANTNHVWLTNQAVAFAPDTGNIESNQVTIKVGSPIMPPPSINFIYYCQGDARWWKDVYACDLPSTGCGPTSLAMILSSFGLRGTLDGKTSLYDPVVTDQAIISKGVRTCGGFIFINSSTISKISSLGVTIGPNLSENGKLNLTRIKEFIDNNYYIVASSYTYPCANCTSGPGSTVNHVVVIDKVTSDNKVSVRDPNSCEYNVLNSPEWQNPSFRYKNPATIDWAYAYPVKKI